MTSKKTGRAKAMHILKKLHPNAKSKRLRSDLIKSVSFSVFKRSNFSKHQLIAFALVFCFLGGYTLYSAFAFETTEQPTSSVCTDELAADGDLSNFLGSLTDNDVGCLRAGIYDDGCSVTWSTDAPNRITLRSYPGEWAVLRTSIAIAGDNLTVSNLEVSDIPLACGGDISGFTVQGANNNIEYTHIRNVQRHGILTNTSASNTTVHGNFIESVGSECNLDHGIYFQRSGRITRNVFKDTRCGYGIHLYSGPSNVIVAQNTSVGSEVRAGILINCSTNCTVVNNIFANNATHGITYRACTSGCVVDNNITWGNGSGSVGDTLASQATNTRNVDPQFADDEFRLASTSPAIDTASAAYAYYPDRDSVATVQGSGPDLGAFERSSGGDPDPDPEPDTTPPSVPGSFRTTGSTTSSISLAWNASTDSGGSGLNNYRIYRNGSLLTSTTSLSYTNTGLSSNTTYSYQVSAVDHEGNESNKTSSLSVKTKAPATTPSAKLGDINKDGKVNIFDLSILLANYGRKGSSLSADLNKDTRVDLFDLSILLARYEG